MFPLTDAIIDPRTPDTSEGSLDPRLTAARRAALDWQVTLWSGEVTADERSRFAEWLGADPLHGFAWEQVQRVGQEMRLVPAHIGRQVLMATRSAPHRRAVLRGMGWLVGAGVAAYAIRETPQWQTAAADLRTIRGEQRDVVLTDGTRITLDTATSVDVRFDAHERRLVLHGGQIFIATARDDRALPRPFVLETAEGTVRPLGTRFAVHRQEGGALSQVLVRVVEGAVEMAPVRSTSRVRVQAGQKASFTRNGAQLVEGADPGEVAWTQGLLVAERMRLGDFVAQIGRYRGGVLRCDPAVAELAISGVYSLTDIDGVLNSLAQALPVRVRSITRYWVTVGPR